MSTVIVGGGIIGLATAYYLSLQTPPSPSAPIHVVDASSSLFASASGFSGGFLAMDWFSPAVADLGALSFRLHRELAEKHGGQRRWGYAGSHVYSLSVDDRGQARTAKKVRGENWLLAGSTRAALARANSATDGHLRHAPALLNPDGSPIVFTPQEGGTLDTIAGPAECAQVEPRELCEFLLEECEKRGVHVHRATRPTAVWTDDQGRLKGLRLGSTSTRPGDDGPQQLECRNVVISAGAWTPRVYETLFPHSRRRIPIDALAGHSIVVQSPRYPVPYVDQSQRRFGGAEDDWLCYSIYCAPGKHWSYAPEAYARLARHGETEIWLGGLNHSTLPLPELATDVKAMIDPGSIQSLRRTTVRLIGLPQAGKDLNHDDLHTVRESLCFRPVSQTGSPIVAQVPKEDLGGVRVGDGGVYIAAGHGPWGITLALGTGLVMSELLMGKTHSVDIRALQIS